mgnify:FL=1
MRRGYLYKKAKQLGCNKIALGHHYDDVIETILMGMLYGGQVQTMMPSYTAQTMREWNLSALSTSFVRLKSSIGEITTS